MALHLIKALPHLRRQRMFNTTGVGQNKAASAIHGSSETHLRAVSDVRSVLERARQQRNPAAAKAAQHHLCAAIEAAHDAGATRLQIRDLSGIARGNAYQKYRRRPAPRRDPHHQSTLRFRMTALRVSRWRQRAQVEECPGDREAVARPAPPAQNGLQTLYGVPTFKALQNICRRYIIEHPYTLHAHSRPACGCRLPVATHDEWVDHVTELQASHIAMAIQEARNPP
jgi:hypothetical protein